MTIYPACNKTTWIRPYVKKLSMTGISLLIGKQQSLEKLQLFSNRNWKSMSRASGSEAFSWRRLEKLPCRSSHIFLFGRKFSGGIQVCQFYRASPVTLGFSPQLSLDGIECWRSGKMYGVIPGEDWNNAAEGHKPSVSDFIRDHMQSENAYHIQAFTFK